MHPQRRIRVLLLAILAIIIFILYLTGDSRRVQNQRFYQQTAKALNDKALRKENTDDEELFQKLRPVVGEERVVAVERQNHPSRVDDVIEGDIQDAGEEKSPEEISGEKNPVQDKSKETEEKKDWDNPEVEEELNAILKRSPSRFYNAENHHPLTRGLRLSTACTGTKAKHILLERYNIVPSPFAVELDQHPLGQTLQSFLADNTGRRTVPNVLVNGRSIGGGDEIEALDSSGELASKIKEFSGKRVMEITRKEEEDLPLN